MEISPTVLASTPANGELRQAVALRMLKESIDLQGQLALQLLPQAPKVDPSSPLGQTIDLRV